MIVDMNIAAFSTLFGLRCKHLNATRNSNEIRHISIYTVNCSLTTIYQYQLTSIVSAIKVACSSEGSS